MNKKMMGRTLLGAFAIAGAVLVTNCGPANTPIVPGLGTSQNLTKSAFRPGKLFGNQLRNGLTQVRSRTQGAIELQRFALQAGVDLNDSFRSNPPAAPQPKPVDNCNGSFTQDGVTCSMACANKTSFSIGCASAEAKSFDCKGKTYSLREGKITIGADWTTVLCVDDPIKGRQCSGNFVVDVGVGGKVFGPELNGDAFNCAAHVSVVAQHLVSDEDVNEKDYEPVCYNGTGTQPASTVACTYNGVPLTCDEMKQLTEDNADSCSSSDPAPAPSPSASPSPFPSSLPSGVPVFPHN